MINKSMNHYNYFDEIIKIKKKILIIKKKNEKNIKLLLNIKFELKKIKDREKILLDNIYKYRLNKFAKQLLHVVDSIEQGLIINEKNKDSDLHKGMKLVYILLINTLKDFGIVKIKSENNIFDPSKHEALSLLKIKNKKHFQIISVIQNGYLQYDRILRHSKVIINKII